MNFVIDRPTNSIAAADHTADSSRERRTDSENARTPDPTEKPWPPPPAPAHPRPSVATIVVGCLSLLAVVTALVGWAGWADIPATPVVALGLTITVAGWIATFRHGGSRAIVPLSIVMMMPVAVVAVAGPHLDDGTGDRSFHPQTFEDVDAEYHFGIGNSSVDFRDVAFPPGVHTISVDVGIGHTVVRLPADVNYQLTGNLDVGRVDLPDEAGSGFGNHVESSDTVGSDATVVLDLSMDIGYAEIRRG